MKRLASLSLAGDAGTASTQPGTFSLPSNRKIRGVRLVSRVPINNTTGGALTLTDAQKQTLLSLVRVNLRYGVRGQPVLGVAGTDLRRVDELARFAIGSEMEGYSNAVTGLARTLPAGAVTTVNFHEVIPTGKLWFLPPSEDRIGIGPTQSRSLILDVTRTGVTAVGTGLSIAGQTITVDVFADDDASKGDMFAFPPTWTEAQSSDLNVTTDDGLHLLVTERTTPHAASALTNVSISVDGDVLVDQMSLQDSIARYNDAPTLPSIASVADRETLILATPNTVRLADLTTGRVTITQNGGMQVTPFLLGDYYMRVRARAELDAELINVANVRGRKVKLVSLVAVEPALSVSERLMPFLPMYVVDEDDAAYGALPGLECVPNGQPRVVVPPMALQQAAAVRSRTGATGDLVARSIAARIPGAVQSGAGFSRGISDVLPQVRAMIS